MGKPAIDIEVDDLTGRRSVDVLPSWFEGAIAYATSTAGSVRPVSAHEDHSEAAGEHDRCPFRIEPDESDGP